jgi:shikimate kinase
MISKAKTFGAVSVLNGIFLGIGASMAIDLKVEVECKIIEEPIVLFDIKLINDTEKVDSKLIFACFDVIKEKFNYKKGFKLKIYSEIPPSRGLKSSSAVGNALIKSMLSALEIKATRLEIAKLCVDACKKAKITITGAFDDACATIMGGLYLVNNTSQEIITKYEIGEYNVVIGYSNSTIKKESINLMKFQNVNNLAIQAYKLILKGDWASAMNINSSLVAVALNLDLKPVKLALENGALASTISGTGPAVVAVTKEADAVSNFWKELGLKTIISSTRGFVNDN